ncbi:MAG: tachylectin-related carbohydrate-binding protein, partial [Pyrinomonadaceae bacterium]
GFNRVWGEEELERIYGIEMMAKLADKLVELKDRGTLRQQFIGTFSKTPVNYQPLWVYAVKNDGDILWYRKDTGESPWQGPKSVGANWQHFTDIVAAGGNSLYALTNDGKLYWYQHRGFNDGARIWNERIEIRSGLRFTRIFAGGEGIVYGVMEDGNLLWYRYPGYASGGGPETVIGPKSVGAQWHHFKEVFGNGQGNVYAVRPNGELLFFSQRDYANGARAWLPERVLATGWQNFRHIVPAGDGVILAIKQDGTMLWYRHYFAPTAPSPNARIKEYWEGPIAIGSGWYNFKAIVAMIPVASAPVVR